MTQPLSQQSSVYPALALRDVVLFPQMLVSLFVGRAKSVAALREAASGNQRIVLLTQKDASDDDPGTDALYTVGTLASIEQTITLPDKTVKLLTEGISRARVERFIDDGDILRVDVEVLEDDDRHLASEEAAQLKEDVIQLVQHYASLSERISSELPESIAKIQDLRKLGDVVASHLEFEVKKRQEILEERDPVASLAEIKRLLSAEVEQLETKKSIRKRLKQQVEKNQREYYLTEQMKAIQRELDEQSGEPNEFEMLAERIKAAKMPKEAREKAEKELRKLKGMASISAEASVVRNYLDFLIDLPWRKKNRVSISLSKAKVRLDQDHHALGEVKERILEYLAVSKRNPQHKGAILCLVGPPGVGKTSLGKSIAEATNRKFIRVSLGGVRDEAEIRGHRRTYVGAMPGKIIQNITKSGTRNPLFMLDEVDKMLTDFRGDASAALLEALDPEQNHAFVDHYLEVSFDLSQVLFIATANSLNIAPALRDRMEIIRLSGYTDDEKVEIARNYLVKRQLQSHALREDELKFNASVYLPLVRNYTREAGVRDLERKIAKICRKSLYHIMMKDSKSQVITPAKLAKYLGPPLHRSEVDATKPAIGQVVGLAWTELGGETLKIQSSVVPGKGRHQFTGKLGEVMQESIKIAVSLIRQRIDEYEVKPDFYSEYDIHVHLPEGATPKDGPSAGTGMCVSILSALTGVSVYQDVAMTGEVNLAGEVLPVGGLKEKLLAAHRAKIKKVLLPKKNLTDLASIPENVKKNLEWVAVSNIDEVFDHALITLPKRHTEVMSSKKDEQNQESNASSVSSSVRH